MCIRRTSFLLVLNNLIFIITLNNIHIFILVINCFFYFAFFECPYPGTNMMSVFEVLSHVGLKLKDQKTAIIQEMKVPTNKTELRSFLGLAGYYRRFIKGFAHISATLLEATSRTKPFIWTHEMTSSFNDLKNRLVSPPILAMPNFSLPFKVETDASNVAVGAVLAQKHEDGKAHPVQYATLVKTKTRKWRIFGSLMAGRGWHWLTFGQLRFAYI